LIYKSLEKFPSRINFST